MSEMNLEDTITSIKFLLSVKVFNQHHKNVSTDAHKLWSVDGTSYLWEFVCTVDETPYRFHTFEDTLTGLGAERVADGFASKMGEWLKAN